jgi:putative FmdB family regulatory protein
MPIYDYVCHHCGHRFEVIHGLHAEGPGTCPVCGSTEVRKGFVAPTVVFKGTGWAKKDRRLPSKSAETPPSAERSATDGDSKAADGDGKASIAADTTKTTPNADGEGSTSATRPSKSGEAPSTGPAPSGGKAG